MANDLTRQPWILDTASANPIKSSPNPNITLLQGVIFSGYTVSTHKCVLKDDRGKTIVDLTGVADLGPVSWFLSTSNPERIVNLTLTTLDSGQCEVIIV